MGDKDKSSAGSNKDAGNESLPVLVGRLGEDILTLIDTKLGLLKIEVKEDLTAYLRGSAAMGAGVIVIVIGFSLLNVALAFVVSSLFDKTQMSQPIKYALGFIITGLFYLIIGAAVVISAKNRLAKQDLAPERSINELKKDKKWIEREF